MLFLLIILIKAPIVMPAIKFVDSNQSEIQSQTKELTNRALNWCATMK